VNMDPFAPASPAGIDVVALLGLALAVFAIGIGWWRGRDLSQWPIETAYEQAFQLDLAAALKWWGLAQLLAGAGWALRFGTLSLPLWSYLVLALGIAAAVFAWLRLRRADWRGEHGSQPTAGVHREVSSDTWQYALIAAAAGGLVGYVLGIKFGIMQPVHLGVSLLLALASYPLGLMIWTPKPAIHRTATGAGPVEEPASSRSVRGRHARIRRNG
jgi:hypothetical protein